MREFGEPTTPAESSGCLKYLLYAGCAILILIGAFLALVPVGIYFAFTPYDLPDGWETKVLPLQLKTTRVLYKKHWGIWRDQCEYVAYEIPRPLLSAIHNQGLAFFENVVPPPSTRDGSPYIGWRETPVADSAPGNSRLFATGAYNGCPDDDAKRTLPDTLWQAGHGISQSGGYYTITRNGYGMIAVLPESGIILFLYST